jgi:hypothetical protein
MRPHLHVRHLPRSHGPLLDQRVLTLIDWGILTLPGASPFPE